MNEAKRPKAIDVLLHGGHNHVVYCSICRYALAHGAVGSGSGLWDLHDHDRRKEHQRS